MGAAPSVCQGIISVLVKRGLGVVSVSLVWHHCTSLFSFMSKVHLTSQQLLEYCF